MQKELKEKRERLLVMNASKAPSSVAISRSSPALSMSQSIQDKKREEEDLKKERRVIKLVVVNSVFNFVLRSPDVLFLLNNSYMWPLFLQFTVNGVSDSWRRYISGLFGFIADIGYFTYTLTFTTNFFIFYIFNKRFNEAVMFLNTPKSRKKI
jgi:hypothetical protein